MNNMMRIIFAALIWLSALQPTQPDLIGYDCSNALTLSSKPLQDMLPSCSYQAWVSFEMDASLVYKNDSEKLTLVRQCTVRYNESAPGASLLMSAWTEKSIGREECLKAHKTEKMDLHGRLVDLEVSGTNRKRVYIVDGRICTKTEKCPNAMIRDYEITLSTHIARLSEPYNILRLDKGDDVWCNYDHFQCQHEGKSFYWENESESTEESCGPEYGLVFSGKMHYWQMVGGKSFVVAYIDGYQFVFELLKQHRLFSQRAYYTQDSSWRIVITTDIENIRKIDLDVELFDKTVTYFKGKVEDAASIFGLIEKSCKAGRERILKRIGDGVLESYIDPGVKVEASDRNVLLQKCQPVPIRIRFTRECFNRVPVYDQSGNEKFLLPFYRVLVDEADAVPCSRKDPPKSEFRCTFKDFVQYVTDIGLFCSFLWVVRHGVRFIQHSYGRLTNMFRGHQPEQAHSDQAELRNDPSKFRRLVNSFLMLVEPPFHMNLLD